MLAGYAPPSVVSDWDIGWGRSAFLWAGTWIVNRYYSDKFL